MTYNFHIYKGLLPSQFALLPFGFPSPSTSFSSPTCRQIFTFNQQDGLSLITDQKQINSLVKIH